MTGTWATTWVDGDIVTAAEFTKAVGKVADLTLSTTATQIDHSSLPSAYSHLRLYIHARGDTAATTTTLGLRLNNDSAANYDYQTVSTAATTTTGAESFAQTSIQLGNIPAASATANAFAVYVIDIPHYSWSVAHKALTGYATVKTGTSTGTLQVRTIAAAWRSTAAVSRVTIFPGAGNFIADSQLSIFAYGW